MDEEPSKQDHQKSDGLPPDSSAELMYVKCSWCGAWTDVTPGPINRISHGMCDRCRRRMESRTPGT